MTMTELLTQRKMMQKKIDRMLNFNASNTNPRLFGNESVGKITSCSFINLVYKSTQKTKTGIPREDIEKDIISAADSITATIDNFAKLTSIKNMINATTKVKICGIEYTIAEAMAFNNEKVKAYYAALIKKLKEDYITVQKTYDEYCAKQFSEENKNNFLKTVSTETEMMDVDAVEKHMKKFYEKYELEFVDPKQVKKWAEELETWYDEFYGTINFRLSEINSTTFVVVDLDEKENFWRYATEEEAKTRVVSE